jgi:hypothetical protein
MYFDQFDHELERPATINDVIDWLVVAVIWLYIVSASIGHPNVLGIDVANIMRVVLQAYIVGTVLLGIGLMWGTWSSRGGSRTTRLSWWVQVTCLVLLVYAAWCA